MSDHQFSFKDGDGSPVFIDCFGDGRYVIHVGDQIIHFDWSDRFGPLSTRKNGQPRELGWRHPFWRAASLWNLQGRRLDGKRAIWHEPKRPVLKHISGRNYQVIEGGEEGYDW